MVQVQKPFTLLLKCFILTMVSFDHWHKIHLEPGEVHKQIILDMVVLPIWVSILQYLFISTRLIESIDLWEVLERQLIVICFYLIVLLFFQFVYQRKVGVVTQILGLASYLVFVTLIGREDEMLYVWVEEDLVELLVQVLGEGQVYLLLKLMFLFLGLCVLVLRHGLSIEVCLHSYAKLIKFGYIFTKELCILISFAKWKDTIFFWFTGRLIKIHLFQGTVQWRVKWTSLQIDLRVCALLLPVINELSNTLEVHNANFLKEGTCNIMLLVNFTV